MWVTRHMVSHCETMCREPPPEHVFMESLAEIDRRKVAEVVRRTRDKKNNGSATHFFALSPKPMAWFHWKRARLSLFRLQPHLPSFIQIRPSFRDLYAKTTFQIVTRDRIADNKATVQMSNTVIYNIIQTVCLGPREVLLSGTHKQQSEIQRKGLLAAL